MRWSWSTVCVLAISACYLDPLCVDRCDGETLSFCEWRCTGKGKIDIPSCEKVTGTTDCAAERGEAGGALSCRELGQEAGQHNAACVDLSLPLCSPHGGKVQCLEGLGKGNCLGLADGTGLFRVTSAESCTDAGP